MIRRITFLFCLLVVLAGGASFAFAQSGGGYELTWTSIDASAGTLTGGAYSLVSVIAQPDAGAAQTGGGYELTGGVGPVDGDAGIGSVRLFMPVILR